MSRRILYVQYTNPAGYPPLEHSSRILADAGWEVQFLGTGSHGSSALSFPAHPRIHERRMDFHEPGVMQKIHYLAYCLWVIAWILFWRPHWLYVSAYHDTPLAWIASWLPGLSVAYHEHDSPVPSQSRSSRIMHFFRRKLGARATFIFPNRRRAELCAPPDCRDVQVVWNCPARDEASSPHATSTARRLRVFYHGSITAMRLPLTVIAAIATLPANVELVVAGYTTVGDPHYVDRMRAEAVAFGIGDRFTYLGQVPLREDLLRHCREADVGLAFMPRVADDLNEDNMTGASNKPFDYLACGLALLVTDRADWKSMFADAGYALTCDPADPQTIATALRWFLEHPDETRAMGERGRQRILKEWNYEAQFEPLKNALSR